MKIGDLARITGTNVETIRYYEREELLPVAARTDSNYRIYGEAHLERLSFIRNCRNLDMTLEEIRKLLRFKDHPADDCEGVNHLLDGHIDTVGNRIRELMHLEQQLKGLRKLCQDSLDAGHCGILNELAQPVDIPPRSHVKVDHVPRTLRGVKPIPTNK